MRVHYRGECCDVADRLRRARVYVKPPIFLDCSFAGTSVTAPVFVCMCSVKTVAKDRAKVRTKNRTYKNKNNRTFEPPKTCFRCARKKCGKCKNSTTASDTMGLLRRNSLNIGRWFPAGKQESAAAVAAAATPPPPPAGATVGPRASFGSSVAIQKLRESKWFDAGEERIFCAVIENGFIVEVRRPADPAAADSWFGVVSIELKKCKLYPERDVGCCVLVSLLFLFPYTSSKVIRPFFVNSCGARVRIFS